jgi:hypothetical protein
VIVARLMGGLGNQRFQFAAGFGMQSSNGSERSFTYMNSNSQSGLFVFERRSL